MSAKKEMEKKLSFCSIVVSNKSTAHVDVWDKPFARNGAVQTDNEKVMYMYIPVILFGQRRRRTFIDLYSSG